MTQLGSGQYYELAVPAGKRVVSEHLVINYNTGLKLGDLYPIQGSIRVYNEGPAPVLLRANGFML